MDNIVDFSKEASYSRLINFLKEEPLFGKITDNSSVAALLKAVAKENELNSLGYFVNIQETSWKNAVNRKSLEARTDLLSYVPHRRVGSIGDLLLTTGPDFNQSNLWPNSIDIPLGSVFSSSDLKFTVMDAYLIPPNYESGGTPFSIPVVQGFPQELNYTVGQTEDYATVSIAGNSIENENILVWVNGILWEKKDSLRDAVDPASKIYTVTNLTDEGGININFGNESFGKRLDAADNLRVLYIITAGVSGNISSEGIVTTVDSIIYDSQGGEVPLICTNRESLTGGKDYEDIESIREFAPTTQQIKYSIISIPEYEAYLAGGDFPYLDKVVVWGATEINEDNKNAPGTFIASEDNKIYIAGISKTGQQATEYELELREALSDKKSPTALIQLKDVNVIFVTFNVEAFVRDQTYNLKTVRENIESVLETEYSLENQEFRQDINNSSYVAVINSADGVHHHITTLSYFKEDELPGLVIPLEIDMEDIVATETTFLLKHSSESVYTLVANTVVDTSVTDNFEGVGAFVGDISGSIDLRFGVGSITIEAGALANPVDEYTFRINFNTTASDALLTKRNQILLFGEAITDAKYDEVY